MPPTWVQNYDPLSSALGSPLAAALPILILSGLLLWGVAAPRAALAGLLTAWLLAVAVFRMPVAAAVAAVGYGACFGSMPIGWIVFSAVFLYNLTLRSGQFAVIKHSVAAISPDRRMQALLIAFCFGSFLEGAAGFGAPVAISAAVLIGLGFPPLQAACLTLLANTSPVAFGSLGIPLIVLSKASGLDQTALCQMAGRQLTLFSLIIPAWLAGVMGGWKGINGCWPALAVCGGVFAGIQFLVANYVGPALVNVLSGIGTLVALAVFLRFWHPRETWRFPEETAAAGPAAGKSTTGEVPPTAVHIAYAWTPWVLLSLVLAVWSLPQCKAALGKAWLRGARTLLGAQSEKFAVPYLDGRIRRSPPAVEPPADGRPIPPEEATYDCNLLATSGTSVFVAAILSAIWLRIGPRVFWEEFFHTLYGVRWALATIACMLGLAFLMKYSGADVTLGLAFVRTGRLYPLFAPLLGWLGVMVTGSDTSTNAMFGSLQRFTAERLGLNPILIVTSNSTGGVMGKMIAAQSIVVAAAATNQKQGEGRILRRVFLHSIVLAFLVGLVTLVQAYALPGTIPQPKPAQAAGSHAVGE